MYQKIVLVGRLGQDPELRYTPSGKSVCSFSVATNRVYTNSEGEKIEETQWHRVTTWGALSETCSKYLAKGRIVLVEGRASTSAWLSKDDEPRATLEVTANTVRFLGGQRDAEEEEKVEDVPF